MNKYNILIYNGMDFVDITDLVETNININDKMDLTFDSGKIILPSVKAIYTKYPGIDFSKEIKPDTPVMINIDDNTEVFRFYTSDTVKIKIAPNRWRHEINLIEPSKSLMGKPIPDITITQPKSSVFQGKYYSDSKKMDMIIGNDLYEVPFEVINNSLDSSKIDGLTIKANTQADVYLTLDIENRMFNSTPQILSGTHYINAEAELEISIYQGNTLLNSHVLYVSPGSVKYRTQLLIFRVPELDYPYKLSKGYYSQPSISPSDQIIKVKMRTSPDKPQYTMYTTEAVQTVFTDKLNINAYLTLSTDKSDVNQYIYLDDVAKKIIQMTNLEHGTNYILSDNSERVLRGILCPEFEIQSYTAWDALEKIGNYINAIPEIGLNSYNEIDFTFRDETPDIEYNIDNFTSETVSMTHDDYNIGYEVNASNVIEGEQIGDSKTEPFQGGWMSVRPDSSDISQLKEDNATFRVRQPIDKIEKIYIKGPKVRITNGSSTVTMYGNVDDYLSVNSYWDISDLTVPTDRWNTFENGTGNGSDNERRTKNTKGNHIHYTRGSKFISGLGYKTQQLSDFLGTVSAPRALMETIMKAAAHYLEDNDITGWNVVLATNANPEVAIVDNHNIFEGVFAQIKYKPVFNARSTVYRYNAYDFSSDKISYANEADRLNDSGNLGEYVRTSLNRLGKPVYGLSGNRQRYQSVPKLGYKTTDNRFITSRSVVLGKNMVNFDIELTEDFLNQSKYLAPLSHHRQFEVSMDDFVHRQDKYKEFAILTHNYVNMLPNETGFTSLGKRLFLSNLYSETHGQNNSPLTYSKWHITKDINSHELNNEVDIEQPINGYSLGTTINLQMEFDDNYSAGPRISSEIIGSGADIFKVQNYVEYTTRLGRFDEYDLTLYGVGHASWNQADSDMYPRQGSLTPEGNILFNLSKYNVMKDAREKYGLNIEVPVISKEETLRVFPGFSKYSGLIRHREDLSIRVGLLLNDYIPNHNDNEVNRSKIQIVNPGDLTITTLNHVGNDVWGIRYRANIYPKTKINGYVVFNENTNELLFSSHEPFDNDQNYTTFKNFNDVWVIYKRSLNKNMYPDSIIQYRITFMSNGGTSVSPIRVSPGTMISPPSTTRMGYNFKGWYNEPSLITLYNFNIPTTSNKTLYAGWEEIYVGENKWVEVYGETPTATTQYKVAGSCPSNYTTYLPNPDLYAMNTVLRLNISRECQEGHEICALDQDGEAVVFCGSKLYKIVPKN